jgi:Protein of unknown function (DUF1592)/Protein of unknown function (DUF1588)/Protein of unknown function (DUF1595)/Protein of unknown function (DUF1587)/Protein of unknown function (DUF1585)
MWRMPSRTKSQLSVVGLLALSLGAVACTGVMDGNSNGTGSTGGTSTSAGGGPTTPGGPDQPVDPNVAKTQPVDPGHVAVHRLNSAEYNNSVADVLGTKLQPADSNWRGGELGGFDNMASVLGVDPDQYQRYFDASEAITKDVFANPTALAKIVTCATTDDAACVKNILSATGQRIFRRPLSAEELTTYSNVYTAARAQGDDHTASVRLMVQSLLASAEFLYRIEYDNKPDSTDKHALSPFELASRLSYFLWSSAPDDQLLSKAADSSLTTDGVLSQAIDYMLGDAKSNRFVMNFAGQWLGIRRVVAHPVAADVYPDWTPALADAASQEQYLFFNEFLRSGRTWLDFVKADINYVTPDLAKAYGMPVPAGASATNLARVQDVADGRRGFVGLLGFLAQTSPDRRSSPTLRGKWILMNLTCTTPPDPPADVPKLEAKGDTTNANVRTVLEAHRANPACAACHALFDPFGLALEQYDGIGKFRTAYKDGSVIDPSTDLAGVKFSGIEGAMGLPGVADIVSKDPKFGTCISQKMLQFSLGRLLTDTDTPYLDVVNTAWLKDPTKASIGNLVHGLVSTETFRSRRGGT